MAVRWLEKGSRALAQVVMNDFPTAADAFFELIDNPIDYRRGRQVTIDVWINKDNDSIVLQDLGGAGMDAEGIADWLQWGSGHPHSKSDIGQYHKGGKAACGYLADSLRIWARKGGQTDMWQLEDLDWKARDDWRDFGAPEPFKRSMPIWFSEIPNGAGFTRIELFNLVKDRRYDLGRLRWKIGSTYRRLIQQGAISVRINGEAVEPLALPLSSSFKEREIDIELKSSQRLRGWVGRLDRDSTKGSALRIPGGIRCLYQNRLVLEGQYFGHLAEGKGLLASLIGEIELNHLKPLSNKTDFQRDTAAWNEVEKAMYEWLQPVVAEFRRAAEAQPISREEKKRANTVRRQLQVVLAVIAKAGAGPEDSQNGAAPGGRKPPTPRVVPAPLVPATPRIISPAQPRTEPPVDAVGVLKRLRRRLGSGREMPPIELVFTDPAVRSSSDKTDDGNITRININKGYCLYGALEGSEAYLAETALIEFLQPDRNDVMQVSEFTAEVNRCVDLWFTVAKEDHSVDG